MTPNPPLPEPAPLPVSSPVVLGESTFVAHAENKQSHPAAIAPRAHGDRMNLSDAFIKDLRSELSPPSAIQATSSWSQESRSSSERST